MASLTNKQKNLLRHAPTETTWVCQGRLPSGDACQMVYGGRQTDRCFICRTKKPKRPKLLWPAYLAACQLAGIEPGTPWPPKPATADSPQPRRPRGRKR